MPDLCQMPDCQIARLRKIARLPDCHITCLFANKYRQIARWPKDIRIFVWVGCQSQQVFWFSETGRLGERSGRVWEPSPPISARPLSTHRQLDCQIAGDKARLPDCGIQKPDGRRLLDCQTGKTKLDCQIGRLRKTKLDCQITRYNICRLQICNQV